MMKISNAIRDIYNTQLEAYSPLSERVDELFKNIKGKQWHYESRVKQLESFALKLETGRCPNPAQIEDFFACTLVVENLAAIAQAEDMIFKQLIKVSRRPEADDITTKFAEAFQFDDLRLYVKWKDVSGEKPSGVTDLLFEIQIKTFLQHAWSIATHDLIYKSSSKDWSKERIAYQIKAMLEHAEVSILEANSLAKSPALNKENANTKNLKLIIEYINSVWQPTHLPSDIKRLAENVSSILSNLKITLDEFKVFLETENAAGRGKNTLNLSPYGIVVQTLFNQAKNRFKDYLMGRSKKFKVLIHKDNIVPGDIDLAKSQNVVVIP